MNTKTLAMAAAALSATVFCPTVFGDVTSANIVGYANETTKSDQQFVQFTPSFVSIENDSVIKLSQLNFIPSRNDSIQMFDENGDNTKTLTYKRKGTKEPYTWYWELDDNGETSTVEDYEFPRGLSVWFCTDDEIAFTQSGAVATKDKIYDIPGDQAFVHAGNCTPVAIKLSQLVFSNLARNDNIQFFDENGDNTKTLTYKRKGTKEPYTWYWELDENGDTSTIDPDEFLLQPGESFWFCLDNEGTVTIPAPKL